MSTRTWIHAIAAGALVAAALTPPAAFAKPMGILLPPKGPHPIPGIPVNPPSIPGVPVKPPKIMGILVPHPDHDHDHWGSGWWWHHHGSPWMVEQGYAVPTRTVPLTTPTVGGPCTCLTKTYLSDGSVEFRDICTKEAATAMPGG